jgi:hypothetical protein
VNNGDFNLEKVPTRILMAEYKRRLNAVLSEIVGNYRLAVDPPIKVVDGDYERWPLTVRLDFSQSAEPEWREFGTAYNLLELEELLARFNNDDELNDDEYYGKHPGSLGRPVPPGQDPFR